MVEKTPEYFYKVFRIMNKEEWLETMRGWLHEQQKIIHRYKELYLSKEETAEDREWYNQRVLEVSEAVPHNVMMMKRVEVEGDYMILYQEDGTLACMLVAPNERKEVYSRLKERKRMIV